MTGLLVRRADGSLGEVAWGVSFDTERIVRRVYLNTTKKKLIARAKSALYGAWVLTPDAVENPFRRLEDAVAAALVLDGVVVELW